MTGLSGRECIERVLAGQWVDRLPVMPIVHAGLAPLFGVSLGDYFTSAASMAKVILSGHREFGFDGVQLSLGVTGEAEALGARVDQPPDGLPVLREHLLAAGGDPRRLQGKRPSTGGRMPLFFDAVQQIVREIGEHTFVLVTMRGPLLAGSQLRGVEPILIDTIADPESLAEVLKFTTEVAANLGTRLLESGAHGLLIGEATCSPNFISPKMYRRLVLPWHRLLVKGLKKAGWRAVGMHICGNTAPIVEDIISTGVDFLDIDYQVPANQALTLVQGRAVCRGNLDPSSVFRFGTAEEVRRETEAVCQAAGGARWILSSGCDIPPGTPAENIRAFVEAAREFTRTE